ncbi:hypothetical protein OHB26_34800 [Nocardia sp. NBC_01503]|uniref:hypothetical protein n=1 Tax=Nocardia sp. NBC_01503 TaxID=2975997 RepID=UPI002E7B0CA3|nr:hypothetical protein [Nocardia sp. NBC_01503]WTL32011.1 hypothetical protein OHB26_34800 [Nocardia sp. NBC_01503]
MSDLRAYAVLTAVPALLAFGSGTAAAQPAGVPHTDLSSLEIRAAADALNAVQVASQPVQLPEGIDPAVRDRALSYLDGVRQQVTTAVDGIELPRNMADRRTDSTVAGGVIGAIIGKVAVFPLEIVGCGVGATVGAIAGGIIGALPTVGAGAPVGAAVGGVAGCLIGGVAVAIPVDVVGLVGGAVIGGFAGGIAGGGADPAPADATQPIVNTTAPQDHSIAPEPVAAAVDSIAAISPDTKAAVTSLRTAIAALPLLTPDALGPLTQPANDLLAAVQAAF